MIAEWIGYAWMTTVCASAIALAANEWQRARRRSVRWVWMAAIATGSMLPALMAIRPRGVRPLPLATDESGMMLTAQSISFAQGANVSWLMVGWVVATAILLLGVGAALISLQRVRRRARAEEWSGTPVAITAEVGPGAAPFGKPAILVPSWTTGMTESDRQLLLAHERSHVTAGDARWLLAATVLVALNPWNLPLWWCLRRLRTAIELDCDARVLLSGALVRPYAELLLLVAGRPKGRFAPGLLTFAHSPSQLHTRIDAMTAAKRLTPLGRAAAGALGVIALVTACETRIPAPVAPVTDYVIQDGTTKAMTITAEGADSAKETVAGVLSKRRVVVGESEDLSQPVIVVEDAAGNVVYSGRAATTSVLDQVQSTSIERVEVLKRSELLPPEAKAGLVTIRLKPGATWPGASADTAAGVFYKKLGVQGAGASVDRVEMRIGAARSPDTSSARGTVRLRSSSPAGADAPTVFLFDGTGKLLYEGPMGQTGSSNRVGPFVVSPDDIGGVDVKKGDATGGRIEIRLKPGVVPKRVV